MGIPNNGWWFFLKENPIVRCMITRGPRDSPWKHHRYRYGLMRKTPIFKGTEHVVAMWSARFWRRWKQNWSSFRLLRSSGVDGWCPPNDKWVMLSHEYYRYITNKNHSEMGLMCTNLANDLGHHPVGNYFHGKIPSFNSWMMTGGSPSWQRAPRQLAWCFYSPGLRDRDAAWGRPESKRQR